MFFYHDSREDPQKPKRRLYANQHTYNNDELPKPQGSRHKRREQFKPLRERLLLAGVSARVRAFGRSAARLSGASLPAPRAHSKGLTKNYATDQLPPPFPDRFVTADGALIMSAADIQAGKSGFQKADLMDYGSLYGMGSYFGPNSAAQYLVKLGQLTEGNIAEVACLLSHHAYCMRGAASPK